MFRGPSCFSDCMLAMRLRPKLNFLTRFWIWRHLPDNWWRKQVKICFLRDRVEQARKLSQLPWKPVSAVLVGKCQCNCPICKIYYLNLISTIICWIKLIGLNIEQVLWHTYFLTNCCSSDFYMHIINFCICHSNYTIRHTNCQMSYAKYNRNC